MLVIESASPPKLESTPNNFVNLLIFSSNGICDIRSTKLIHLNISYFSSLMDYETFESRPYVIFSTYSHWGAVCSHWNFNCI